MTRLQRFISIAQQNKRLFFVTFFVTIFLTYSFLYIVDFYPEPQTETAETEESAIADEDEEVLVIDEQPAAGPDVEPENLVVVTPEAALPLSITIDKLDRTIPVKNPSSNSIAVLDEVLLSGVVRHPDSADFSEPGNVFILGHSSYLPNVLNRNFQAFNGIQNLRWGDEIYVDSADTRYTYRVEKVYEAKAADVVVPHTPGEARLTLATCNSFASKDDRFIIEAILVDSASV